MRCNAVIISRATLFSFLIVEFNYIIKLNKYNYLDHVINKALAWKCCKFRSCRLQMFFKIGILKNFAKFKRKDLCQSLFFIKVAALQACNFLKETLAQVFFCEFYDFFKNTFFIEHLHRLVLWIIIWIFKLEIINLVTRFFLYKHRFFQCCLTSWIQL